MRGTHSATISQGRCHKTVPRGTAGQYINVNYIWEFHLGNSADEDDPLFQQVVSLRNEMRAARGGDLH